MAFLTAALVASMLGRASIRDEVIYEVNLRAMSPQGDLIGAAAKLDHIQSLGATTVWLMPIHPIGQVRSAGGLGSPYSVRSYDQVAEEFGGKPALRAFVRQAHDRGMKVMLDWVANHTAWDHAWIQKKGYHAVNEKGEITIPPGTNWNDVAELNYDSAEMRAEMIQAMVRWVTEEEIDGFRCDYADGVPFDFWKAAITACRSASSRPLTFLAEGSRPDHRDAGFDMLYDWEFFHSAKEFFEKEVDGIRFTKAIQGDGQPLLRYTTNHDESAWDSTPIAHFGGSNGAFAAFAFAALSGQVPLIYGSQEVHEDRKVPFFTKQPIRWDQNPFWLERYQALMEFRGREPLARIAPSKVEVKGKIASYTKAEGGSTLHVVMNTSDESYLYTMPRNVITYWRLPLDSKQMIAGKYVTLKPKSTTVFLGGKSG